MSAVACGATRCSHVRASCTAGGGLRTGKSACIRAGVVKKTTATSLEKILRLEPNRRRRERTADGWCMMLLFSARWAGLCACLLCGAGGAAAARQGHKVAEDTSVVPLPDLQ